MSRQRSPGHVQILQPLKTINTDLKIQKIVANSSFVLMEKSSILNAMQEHPLILKRLNVMDQDPVILRVALEIQNQVHLVKKVFYYISFIFI